MTLPEISVIVPAYNVEKYLSQSLKSLSNQNFQDFEVIVVDDASTDSTLEVARSHEDRRVRVIQHSQNAGVAAARNTGIHAARGEFIAILDSDDIAMPERLLHQRRAFEGRPRLGLVGSHVGLIDDAGRRMSGKWRRPLASDEAKAELCFRNAFCASFMFRRVAAPIDLFGDYPVAEDYSFVVGMSEEWDLINLREQLTMYRVRSGGLTHTKKQRMEQFVRRVMSRQLQKLGINPTTHELDLNRHIGAQTLESSESLLDELDAWLCRLLASNERNQVFDRAVFSRVLTCEWYRVCKFASPLGFRAWSRYWGSHLAERLPIAEHVKFVAKCWLKHGRKGGDCIL